MWKTTLHLGVFLAILLLGADLVLAQGTIPNPIGSSDFPTLILNVTTAIRNIGMLFAVFAIVIIGFKFLQASATDNPTGIKDAKKYFWWTLIGTAVVVGASAIAAAVINFAKGL